MMPEWLLLIHQIPWKPGYLRVKISRRLQRIGAIPLKNSVYVLPMSEQSIEDFQWVIREITEGGGEAYICQSHFVGGLTDEQVITLFQQARDADYSEIAQEAQQLLDELPDSPWQDEHRRKTASEVSRLRRRMAEVNVLNFFSVPAQQATEALLSQIENRLHQQGAMPTRELSTDTQRFQGKVWITRKGIKIDRMASAWLIRRFIDPTGQFKYVKAQGYEPRAGEIRFDMFNAEFTHEGDCCTFEVLLYYFGLRKDPALRIIGEIIHDIDLKDEKFGRAEAAGIDRLTTGVALACSEDEQRLVRASAIFDDLYEYFRRETQ